MSTAADMIDWARTEELRAEVGEDDFAEIAGLFLSELAETAEALSDGLPPATLSDMFHGLKGSALNLGFTDVATRAAEGEAAPASADIPALQAACAAAMRAFSARYGAGVI
ncbi:Hpt domain-containing protein [Ovoidimarina sediminis]|uniref:Hpt domain-containing protein n=1 Tax=Ovoidimarina sediminis TaxID=3079856 RepID=UPI00290CF24F|nr:Hpt domain-containing protein [Rhodophyticola sp. MJ-SS7]MDU8944537.1 Hpt domain-containing protein [Rhodophyticola sp. MJ-SS7]